MRALGNKKNTADQNWNILKRYMVLNELWKMKGEPDAIKEYWAVDLKTGNKFILLRLRRELK